MTTDGNDDVPSPVKDEATAVAHRSSRKSSSELDRHTDPFAIRQGKTLVWSKVNMTLAGTKDTPDRKILDNVFGEVPSKQTTALMGGSGAGKTSLLNVLAGRASSHGRVTITSDVRLNNYTVDPSNIKIRKTIAFVAQDDSLQPTATPREAIRFSAKLRLPRNTTEEQLDALTERMITELGLTACADSMVGGELVKGISGGERKRTSVGVELVVKPAMVFLDEPTSGLDSFSAVQLCQVLKKVANAGAAVLFTIHQPSSEIFNSFDHLILLNKGRVMYTGAIADIGPYFAERGHPNPPNYNPADWIITVAQTIPIKTLEEHNFFPKDERNLGEAFVAEEGHDPLGLTTTRQSGKNSAHSEDVEANANTKQNDLPPPGAMTQISMLFTREFQNLSRDTVALAARFGITIFLSTLIGLIFFQVGAVDNAIAADLNSHFGSLVLVLTMSMFGVAQPALVALPAERPLFLREYSTDHYSAGGYFLSKLTMECFIIALQVLVMCLIMYFLIQFQMSFVMFFAIIYVLSISSSALAVLLGSAVEDPKVAQEMLPIVFVPQMLFSGFFVIPALIPLWLRWCQYLCSLTYALRIALVEEFYNCDPSDNTANQNCNELIDRIGAVPDDTWWNWLVLLALFTVARFTALNILRTKALKFF